MRPRSIHEFATWPAVLLASLGLAACDLGFSIHPVIEEDSRQLDPAPFEGLWITGDPDDYWVLRIAPVTLGTRSCPEVDLRVWKKSDSLEDPPMLAGRACLAEVAGQQVAEVILATEPTLYQLHLLRLGPSRISACGGASAWALFHRQSAEEAPAFTMEGLDYTVRHQSEFDEVFVVSPTGDLRAYLDRNLPRLAGLCDAAQDGEEEPRWLDFERITPAPPGDAATP